jgi:uncharacterized membrane protein HdeD (DUF308 family)
VATTHEDAARRTAGAGWGWIVGYGILSLLVGYFAFARPLAATLAASVVLGIGLVLTGAVAIAVAARAHDHEGRGYSLAIGATSLVAGLFVLYFPAGGALSLTIIVTAWLAIRGVSELVMGFRYRFGRAWMLILGAVNVILALYLWYWLPLSALLAPGIALGISFLLGGVNAVLSGLNHKKGAPAFAV